MASNQEFNPDWASAPGETIVDALKERDVSITEFTERMGHTREAMEDLLHGRATITIAMARKLEKVIGASLEFWMSRDFQYREDTAKLRQAEEETWIGELPIGDMIKFGWLAPVPHPSDEVAACLRFFDVPSVGAWRNRYAGVQEMAAFRTSPSFDSRPAAVAAWLRQGEIEAEAIDCSPWDAKRLHETLSNIRPLTRKKDPRVFIPELKRRCAECGVAVAIVRAPTGCRASGVTRFISEDKALLMLSFRYLTDDHFWFTFFHEAGHLLLHGDKGFFLEIAGMAQTTEEQEANDFAARTLVPPEFLSEMLSLPVDRREVIRFAMGQKVSPGIVVGQLQHFCRIKHNQLNRLKRQYKWED